jgi:hypothetical protein
MELHRSALLGTLCACLLLVLGGVLSSCGNKAPVPPPEYEDPARAPTGINRLEERIVAAEALATMDDATLEQLRQRASIEMAADKDLSDYVAALAGRGKSADALQFLHGRAWKAVEDQGKAADALGFAMGQLRWTVCAQMARDYLEMRHSSGGFLIRGLCLERSGNHAASVENLRAATEVNPIDPENLDLILVLVERRGSSRALPPGDPDLYRKLQLAFVRRPILDRLFLHELMGYEPDLPLGSLDPGGLSAEDVRDVTASRARSYRHCYHLAEAQAKSPRDAIRGRAAIEFEIDAVGRVRKPRPVLADWADHPLASELNGCLMGQLERLRFPRPRYGLPQLARHEFAFQPG